MTQAQQIEAENKAGVVSLIALKRRAGLSTELFDAYWANVHAPIMARMPGIWRYTLHHIDVLSPANLDIPAGIEQVPPSAFEIEGIAELTYLDADGAVRAYTLSDDVGGYTHHDAQNVFAVGLFYQTQPISQTLKDIAPAAEPGVTLFIAFQYADGIDRDAGHALVDGLAKQAVASDHSSRVRSHLLREYDNDSLHPGLPPIMRHTVLPSEAIDGIIEIAAEDRTALSRLLRDIHFGDDAAGTLRAVHCYQRRTRNIMVHDGKITNAGIRTPYVCSLIDRFGAISQEHEGLDELMLRGFQGD